MSQENNTQKQDNNTQKEDSIGESIIYLKRIINYSGIVLVVFLIIFTFGIFFTQCTKKDYTNSLASIESATQYQPINKMEPESSGQIVTNLTTINNNNEVLRKYLDKDVKNQFDNIGSTIGALNNQITMLYTLLSNSLTIISIILGMFTLIIAVFGFYISNVITARYKDITSAGKDVDDALTKAVKTKVEIIAYVEKNDDELYRRHEENRRKKIIVTLKKSPELINLFYNELLLDVDRLDYSSLLAILQNLINKLKNSKIIKLYVHLLLLTNTQKLLKDSRVLNAILASSISKGLLGCYYPLDKYKIIIKTLIDYKITEKDLKEYADLDSRLADFLKKFVVLFDGSYFESVLINYMSEEEQDEFIDKLMSISSEICQNYIKIRRPRIGSSKNTEKEQALLAKLEGVINNQMTSQSS